MKSLEVSFKTTEIVKAIIVKLLTIATLTIGLYATANAGTSTVTCTNVDDSGTCSIDGDGGFSSDFADLISNVIKAEDNQFGDVCQKLNPDSPNNDAGYAVACSISSTNTDTASKLEIGCKEIADGEGLTCELKNLDPELLKINCEKEGDNGGNCRISTSSAAAEKALEKVPSLTTSQIKFGSSLLESCASRTAIDSLQQDCDAVLSALSNGDSDKIAATLAAVTPTNFDLAIDFGKQAVYAQIKTLNNRLKDLRASEKETNSVSLQFFDGRQWLKTGDLLASAGETMNDSAPENALLNNSRLGFFVNGTLMSSEQKSTENEGATETSSQMLTLGIDYRFTNNMIGGFAFNFNSSDTDYAKRKGDLSTSGFSMVAYGSYFVDDWYIDASIMRGGSDHEQTRNLKCDASCVEAFEQTATADYYGSTTAFSISGGYDFTFNALSVTPFAQLNSTKIELDAYKESMSDPAAAGGGYGLDMKDQSRSMMTFSIGSQFRYVWAQSWGVVVPHLDLELVRELDDDDNVIAGNFIGNVAKTEGFKLSTNQIDTTYLFVGFGASAQLQNGNSGFINIRTLQGYNNLDQTIYSLGWRWEL